MRPGGARDSNPRRWVSDPTNQNFSTRHNRLKSTELRTFERDGTWTTTQTTTYLAPCFGDFDNSVSIWSHAPPRPPAFSPSPAPRDTFGRIAQLLLKGLDRKSTRLHSSN